MNPDFRPAETFDEPDKILKGLPVGGTVKIKMRAANEANSGPFGNLMKVVVN